jgi:hypothetical protein
MLNLDALACRSARLTPVRPRTMWLALLHRGHDRCSLAACHTKRASAMRRASRPERRLRTSEVGSSELDLSLVRTHRRSPLLTCEK